MLETKKNYCLKKMHQPIQSKPHWFGLVRILFLKSTEPNQTAWFFISRFGWLLRSKLNQTASWNQFLWIMLTTSILSWIMLTTSILTDFFITLILLLDEIQMNMTTLCKTISKVVWHTCILFNKRVNIKKNVKLIFVNYPTPWKIRRKKLRDNDWTD